MTPEDELIRAEEAKQVLKNPVMVQALREIEIQLIEQLATQDIAPERAVRVQMLLAAKRAFERMLKTYIQTGEFVIEERRRKANAAQRAANFFRVR